MPDLSIIIVSWNVADLLIRCLDTINLNSGSLHLQVIVVDSASQDQSIERVKSEHPWVILLPQTTNVGFTRGNNIGLKHATGRHVLLLNPDTEIIGNMLSIMVAYLDSHVDVGILGPHTLNTDNSTQSSRRRFPTLATAYFESTWLQPMAPKTLLDTYYIAEMSDYAVFDVDWIQGHALMARRTVYEQIGGLDEGYTMYFEELDWCRRAVDAGWRVVYHGGAQVKHYGGGSSEQAGAWKYIHFNRSKIRYIGKYHGTVSALILRLFLLIMFSIQLIVESLKWLIRHKPRLRRERIIIYWQVIRSGL